MGVGGDGDDARNEGRRDEPGDGGGSLEWWQRGGSENAKDGRGRTLWQCGGVRAMVVVMVGWMY